MTFIPNLSHIISVDNSTAALLGAGASFVGAWEDVTNYTTIAVAVIGSLATDGTIFIDVSMDGGTTLESIPYSVGDATFDIPRIFNVVEQYARVRYVNGTTPQTGTFSLQTKYSNGQQLGVLTTISQPIRDISTATITKSVITGADPNGDFTNIPAAGYVDAVTTQVNLGGGAAFAPAVCVYVDGFSHVSIELLSDQDGTFTALWYSDEACTDLTRTFSRPYTAADGFAYLASPVFGKYFKVVYTNGATPQTDFHLGLKLLTESVGSFVLQLTDFVPPNAVANIVRSIQMGKDPNDEFINTPANGIDDNNTTAALLGALATFTGAWSKIDLYGEVKIAYEADVDATSCELQLSHDGVTIDTTVSVPPQPTNGTFSAIHTLNPSLPYFRVVYKNGTTPQATFYIVTTLLVQTGNGFISRATQIVDKFNDVKFTRVINNPEIDRNLGLINYQRAVRKFGTNESVANTAFETIWAGADLGGVVNYVFPIAAEGFRVKAGGNVNDTAAGTGARNLEVTFLDAGWNEIVENVELLGASASIATANGYRILRAKVIATGTYGGTNAGDIIIENVSTGTEVAYIPAGIGITHQCIYTVPAGKTAYISQVFVSVGSGNSADVRVVRRNDANGFSAPFGTSYTEWSIEDYSGANHFDLETYLKFEEYTDIWAEAKRITGSGTARVSVDFEITLVDND